jgi:formyltetrahydrofolate deformylase
VKTPLPLVLLVSCPDRPGIVAAVAQALFEHGANILDLDHHTDATAGRFFARFRFTPAPAGSTAPAERNDDGHGPLRAAIGELGSRFGMELRLTSEADRKRLVVFVSRFDHCLWDLLLRHAAGELPCEIPLIVSNHSRLAPVAAQFAIPFEVVPVTAATKVEAERRERALLAQVGADVIVLARYMQVLSADFIADWPNRIINIHHSFLPAFQGARPYHQAHERGAKLTGATAHYVTTDLDDGPIIDQDVIRSSHRDTVEDLVRKGRDVERTVLARAVRWHLEDRILVHGNRTVVFG